MFKHLSSVVKCSSGILGLYFVGLAMLSPIADAGEYNSNPGAFSSAKDESAIEGGKGSDNKGDDSYRPNPNRLAKLRAIQLQAQLEADRNAYLKASNRVKQVQVKTLETNPQSSAFPQKRNNSSAELASAKAVQTQAAINLSATQHRLSIFLRSVKLKRNEASSSVIGH